MDYSDLTQEGRELAHYIQNNATIQADIAAPIMRSLARAMRRGLYTADKAVLSWQRVARAAAMAYHREYCGKGDNVFRPSDKRHVAEYLTRLYQGEIERMGREGI